jgi:shikimate kinase
VALQVLEALPSVLRDPAQAPAEPVRLQDADGQARRSFN